jgi:RNA polymerase sigma-70 factor (ECF subfamily)
MKNPNIHKEVTTLGSAIRHGDEAAFRFYYEERLVYLVGRIQKLTGSRDEAWDIVQDTFVKLWEGREQIDSNRSLDAFVVAMAVNAAHDTLRKKQVHARYNGEQLHTQTEVDHTTTDARLIRSETHSRIDALIESMPAQRRTVFRLSREEGLTYNEIAERMGISPGTVHKHMKIALDELRGILSALLIISLVPLP